MTRAAITTAVRAHRCLRRLPNYTPALPSRLQEPDPVLGALVGTYLNPGSDGAIVRVHADGLRWQGAAQALDLAYDDLAGIDAPGGDTSETLTLATADGLRYSLPVRGRHGRFHDSVAMRRFLTRVREDRSARAG